MPVRRNRTHAEARLYHLCFCECRKYGPRTFQKLSAEWILGSGEVVSEPFVNGVVVQQDVSGTVGANVDARCMQEMPQGLTKDGDPHEQSWKYVERQLPPDHLSYGSSLRACGVDHDISVNSV